MRHLPVLEVMQRGLREVVCTRCFMRPAGSETFSPDVPRACEGDCSVFMNLPQLRHIAQGFEDADPAPGVFERAIQETICAKCAKAFSGGDYCAEHLAETCPLSVYGRLVLDTLEKVAQEVWTRHARNAQQVNAARTPGQPAADAGPTGPKESALP